jgi:hypothetical protein
VRIWHFFCQLNEGGGLQADKVGRQFSGSTTSKKQTFHNQYFQGLWPYGYICDMKARLEEDMVLIRDIPEPIIKSSYAI